MTAIQKILIRAMYRNGITKEELILMYQEPEEVIWSIIQEKAYGLT